MIGAFIQINTGHRPLGYVITERGCWEWVGAVDTKGYGFLRRDNRTSRAHRWMYESEVGPIPEGHDLHHKCENRLCVNPKHLEPLTRREHLVVRHTDSLTGKHAAKTHCVHGHEYTDENTYWWRGTRNCKTCAAARDKLRKRDPEKRRAYNRAYHLRRKGA